MKSEPGSVESRIMILEEKLEYQDYTIEKLNDVLFSQQRQLDKLEEKLQRLEEKIQVSSLNIEEGGKTRPPHY